MCKPDIEPKQQNQDRRDGEAPMTESSAEPAAQETETTGEHATLRLFDEPTGVVYHYTSAAGLVGIIDSRREANVSRQLTFFASDLLQMNDITELAFGMKLVKEQAESLAANEQPPAFFSRWLPILEKYLSTPTLETLNAAPRPCVCITSFTTSADLLSQWATYGSGGGFAIGLDAEALRGATHTGHNIRTGESHVFRCSLGRVRYGEDARAQIAGLPLFTKAGSQLFVLATELQTFVSGVSALFNWAKDQQRRKMPDVREHAAAAMAIAFAAQCKDEAFAAETESRLLVGGSPGDLTTLLSGHYPPSFRTSGTRLLPYRPITVIPTDDQPLIRDLVVGPAPNQVQLVHTAQQLLIANGHDPGVVRASPIPYRGW